MASSDEVKPREKTGLDTCLRYCLFAFTLWFVICGLTICTVGIFIAIDRNFLSNLLGTELFATAAYLLIIAGAVVLFIAFFGCCGARTENKCLVMTYFIFLAFIFLFMLIAGILAAAFRSDLGEPLKDGMVKSLRDYYGEYRAVTDAWDWSQYRLSCCGVNESGWDIYQESKWVTKENEGINFKNPRYRYVPESCCVRDYYGFYRDVEQCQSSMIMPPGVREGGFNDAIHYMGCFEEGKRFLIEHASVIIGLGIGIALTLIFGMVLAICYFKRI